jgi:hypothetical protein
MQLHHYLFFVVLIVGGYVLGRVFPQPGQMVGLP